LNDLLDLGHIDMIIHAATPASAQLNSENSAEMLRINIEAMKSVLKYAGNNKPFLFTSSGAVYGTQPQSRSSSKAEGEVEPHPPIEQLNAYAQGKQSECVEKLKAVGSALLSLLDYLPSAESTCLVILISPLAISFEI